MGISQFPAPSSGGLSNDFILDRNNTNNTTFALPREFEAGGYALVTSTNDSTFDVYLLNAAGSSVGYTNGSSIVASEAFDTVVAYGLSTAATVQFQYRGPSTNATSTGLETGAGAFLTSIFPADLPNPDDTATVAGGNFGTGVQITFESGTVVLSAKNVVVGSSTALVVTRPDNLIEDNAPYNLRAVNPGITQPSGSNANILTGTVTAGADPSFITPALITGANPGTAFSTSILVSDSDGTVVNWAITAGTLPAGLSLATATGAISGTPTTAGDYYFTVRITDDGQNTNSRQFNLPVGPVLAGTNSTVVGGTTYVWLTSSGSFAWKNGTGNLEYILIAGGGAGGANINDQSGAGGAGGLLWGTIVSAGTGYDVTIGAGGAGIVNNRGANGTDSVISAVATAFGGGGGGRGSVNSGTSGNPGGSGGGGGSSQGGGAGTAGQGFAGQSSSGGGGGAAEAGGTDGGKQGGDGRLFGAWASAVNIVYNGGYFAGGGGANDTGGLGGGGDGSGANGSANSGGGGGNNIGSGASGLFIVRR